MLLGLRVETVKFPHFRPFPWPGQGIIGDQLRPAETPAHGLAAQPSPSLFFPVLGRVTAVTLHLLVMAVVQGPQPCL